MEKLQKNPYAQKPALQLADASSKSSKSRKHKNRMNFRQLASPKAASSTKPADSWRPPLQLKPRLQSSDMKVAAVKPAPEPKKPW